VGRGEVADKSNRAGSTGYSRSVERRTATLLLLVGMPFFRFEPGFLRRACRSRRLALPGNHQCATDELAESLLGQIAVATLAPHVTGDYTDATFGSKSGRKLVEKPCALLVVEGAGTGNIPEDLDARRGLVDVLAAGARRSRYSDVQLVAWDRERIVDREKILGRRRRWRVAHLVTASETA
jgi:hypothetical protein